MTKSSTVENVKRRTGGGAATAGGMNFQAAATAIAYVAVARGRPLGWLGAVEEDIPVAIEAETESGGDDLRLELANGASVEIQVKKGLRAGKHLWEALDALAVAAAENVACVLLISPSSSTTIRTGLAQDIAYHAAYLVPFMVIIKVLAVAAIVSRISVGLSDLAYAGILFHLLLSGLAHIGAGKPLGAAPALIGLLLLAASFNTQNSARERPSPHCSASHPLPIIERN